MAASGHKNISRIDNPKKHTHGWYVRIKFGDTKYSKFFSDEGHGDREQALEKAIQFRNNIERQLGKPRTDRAVIASSSRTNTGVIGVHRRVKKSYNKNGERVHSEVYEVTWNPEPNVICRTSVSIEKHGEKEAFRRACSIRRQKEREMYGNVVTTNWASSLSKLCAA